MTLHRDIIGDQSHNAAFDNPFVQARIAAVEGGAAVVQNVRAGLPVHLQNFAPEARVKADHVAAPGHGALSLHRFLKPIEADIGFCIARNRMEIDKDGAARDAAFRHLFNAEALGLRDSPRGHDDVLSAAPAIVEDRLGDAVTICIEFRANMAKGVPLSGILRVEERPENLAWTTL